MNPNYNYLYICERISRYDFKWRHLAGLMVKAARLGNEVEFAEDSEHNPARVPLIKALREVLDRSMGIHLCLKDATELTDYAVKIASGSLYEDTEIDVLQNKINAIYCPKEEEEEEDDDDDDDDDDDFAAEASLDAEPVSNSFGVMRHHSDHTALYLSLEDKGFFWVDDVRDAARFDLLVAKGFLNVFDLLVKERYETDCIQHYLVAFT